LTYVGKGREANKGQGDKSAPGFCSGFPLSAEKNPGLESDRFVLRPRHEGQENDFTGKQVDLPLGSGHANWLKTGLFWGAIMKRFEAQNVSL
jgi:hypothetical protein